MLLKQNSTAQPLMFQMIDSSDHITGKTGLTPTVTLSKNGGAFAPPAGTVTELANGWYKVAGNATDTGTLGPLILNATGAGADPVDVVFDVVAFDPQSATNLGLSTLTTIPTAAANAAGLLDLAAGVEAGLTLREALRGMVAALLGKVSGADTTEISFRDQADTKDRIVATVTADGNRTAITKDLT